MEAKAGIQTKEGESAYSLLRRHHRLTTAVRLYGGLWALYYEGSTAVRQQMGSSTWERFLQALARAGIKPEALEVRTPLGLRGLVEGKILRYGSKRMVGPGMLDDIPF